MLDDFPQSGFRLSLGIYPGGIKITDAAVNGGVDDLDGFIFCTVVFVNNALPAKTQDREGFSGFAKMKVAAFRW